MTQNEIEKKIENIESTIDKMTDNYNKTLNDIMVEQEKQKCINSDNHSLISVFKRQEQSKNYDFIRFIGKLWSVAFVVISILAVLYEILTHFIPVV